MDDLCRMPFRILFIIFPSFPKIFWVKEFNEFGIERSNTLGKFPTAE
jgi:hypothetical protein